MEGNKVVGPPYETWFYISDRDLLRIVLRMVLYAWFSLFSCAIRYGTLTIPICNFTKRYTLFLCSNSNTSAQYALSKEMNQGFAIMSRLLPIADGS